MSEPKLSPGWFAREQLAEALKRIEVLEAEVGRLKGPTPPPPFPYLESRTYPYQDSYVLHLGPDKWVALDPSNTRAQLEALWEWCNGASLKPKPKV